MYFLLKDCLKSLNTVFSRLHNQILYLFHQTFECYPSLYMENHDSQTWKCHTDCRVCSLVFRYATWLTNTSVKILSKER